MAYKFALLWFTVSTVLVAIDAAFILLRPRTLRGGDLFHIFQPYEIYLRLDKNYGDVEHTFTISQSWGNLFEACLNMATITLLLRRNAGAVLCGFFVSTLTWYKTVLYMMQYLPICNGAHLLAHLSFMELVSFVALNGIWVVIPGYLVAHYGRQLMTMLRLNREKTD